MSFPIEPFGSAPVTEIHLDNAPLRRVLAQVRFPRLGAFVTGNERALEIAKALEADYPLFEQGQEIMLTISPDGVTQSPSNGNVWQLKSGDQRWVVTFGSQYITLNTESYTNRAEFLGRFETLLHAFASVVLPPFIERVGWRYVNRLDGVSPIELRSLIRPEMLGGVAAYTESVAISNAMNEALYEFSAGRSDEAGFSVFPNQIEDGLQARWGVLPAGGVIDPTLPPWPSPGWVLDLDAFATRQVPFEAGQIMQSLGELSERAYRYFRWVATPAFLERFGSAE